MYRTSRSEDKKALLAAFRQVSQELGEKKRKESEKEQVRRKTMWLGDVRCCPFCESFQADSEGCDFRCRRFVFIRTWRG